MEGVPPPPKASFIPQTLTQLPLWCKKKKKKKMWSLGMDGERKLGPLPISPGQEG